MWEVRAGCPQNLFDFAELIDSRRKIYAGYEFLVRFSLSLSLSLSLSPNFFCFFLCTPLLPSSLPEFTVTSRCTHVYVHLCVLLLFRIYPSRSQSEIQSYCMFRMWQYMNTYGPEPVVSASLHFLHTHTHTHTHTSRLSPSITSAWAMLLISNF